MSISVNSLPQDVLLDIFSYCSFKDLVLSIQFVCSWWQEVSRQKCLWKNIIYRPISEKAVNIFRISPRLQAVDLGQCYPLKCIIEALHKYCPELQRLQVSTDIFFPLFDLNVTVFHSVKVLILNQGLNDFRAWQCLGKFFPNLERIEVYDFYLTKSDLITFLASVKPQLHSLSVPCYTHDKCCTLPYLVECPKLQNLTLLRMCTDLKNVRLEQIDSFTRISSLTFRDVLENRLMDNHNIFSVFPNLKNLELCDCNQPSDEFLQVVSKHCPKLQKLTFSAAFCFSRLHDYSITNLPYLRNLTSLTILYNGCITIDCIMHLQNIPHLSFLETYACKKLTPKCLKVICGFQMLKVLKFDLRYKERLLDLSASHVRNRNLQLLFYRCRDLTKLENLRKQNLRVGILPDRLGKSLLLH